MLGLSARAVGFYAAFAFPLALFCATVYFTDETELEPAREQRRLRIAQVLTLLAPVHVVFPLTAFGIVVDAGRLAKQPAVHERQRGRRRVMAMGGIAVSIAVFLALTAER